jgi:hypothetical protein
MLNEGASLGDSKGKSQHPSRGEKRQRELEARWEPTQCYAGASGSISDVDKPNK